MQTLFDSVDTSATDPSWRSGPPPDLSHVQEIELDFETTGLRWWVGDVPGGAGLALPDGSLYYLAWGHRGGGNNLSEDAAKRYFRNMRNLRITNLNTRFEVHMAREWAGVDFEAQGCEVSDVGHYAGLLDDHRQHSSLESLVRDLLEGEEKVKVVNGVVLDPTRMMDYHASIVAVRAMADVRQVQKLKRKLWPLLDAEDLQRVRKLEDEVIYPVCEMEKNAAIIDQELLRHFIRDCEQELLRTLWEISRGTRIHDFNPNARASWVKLFRHEGIEVTERTEPSLTYPQGQPSFKDITLKKIDNKNVQLGRKAGKLQTLLNTFLRKMSDALSDDGKLRYALHQMRAKKDEWSDHSEAGTISGRFASTEITDGEGVNQQQVMKAEKQIREYGDNYLIRQLYVPQSGLFFTADAMQIEYRLFAHFAENPRVIAAYRENPLMSFHKFVWELIKPFKPDITYRRQKDLNFAKVYGAGLKKLALMLEFITQSEFRMLNAMDYKTAYSHPLLAEAKKVDEIYNRVLPEVKPLLAKASHLAMPDCSSRCNPRDALHAELQHRGYVRTILGRRTRFPDHRRIHKAFNGVDQGSGADIMKRKLVELHRERKHTGFVMRWTAHDEVDGDIPDVECAAKVAEILNVQSFPELKVPILWEWKTGRNWRECAEDYVREK